MAQPLISVIIPALNEAESIDATLTALATGNTDHEVIVVDGGSTDATLQRVAEYPGVRAIESQRGRAVQMNAGAKAARGAILFFLHADTTPPEGWRDSIRAAVKRPRFALGAFRLGLDRPRFAYRVIEQCVWWGNRWFRRPFGDQGFFVMADTFRDVGGYDEWPLMEDVAMVDRLRKRGRICVLPEAVVSSARNWDTHGVWRQTWLNWRTYRGYRRGRPIEELAQRYHRDRRALVVFCKYPAPGRVKTRLAAAVGAEQAADYYRVMVENTLRELSPLRGDRTEVVICFDPPSALPHMKTWLGAGRRYLPQSSGDLGARMLSAFRKVRRNGRDKVLIVGTDCPALRARHVEEAFDRLARHDVVLGPTRDGGYYLIGLNRPQPGLFRKIPWSTGQVMTATLAAVERNGLRQGMLEELRDVDTEEDLHAFPELSAGMPVSS